MSPYAKMVLYYSIIAVLIVASAFFSCADMVFSSVDLRRLSKAKGKRAKLAQQLAKNYESTIVVILFGNNLANIVASSLGAAIAMLPLDPYQQNPSLAATIIEFSMLGIILCFGEILPKTIGRRFNFKLSLAFAPIVRILAYVFYPFTTVAGWIAKGISRPVITQIAKDDDTKTDEELQAMVDVIEEEGIIDEDQSELLTRSLEFKDTEAYMVMTPRVRIEGIEIGEDPIKAIESGRFTHSRIPVYRRNLDNIEGYIPIITLQKAILSGKNPQISEYMVPILCVPRTMPISSILELFKENKRHIALVKDEFGGNEGILTMEDILEELVGEMYDESEESVELIERLDKRNVYRVQGKTEIEDFFAYFDLPLPDEEPSYSTFSGWVTALLGRFAVEGDSFKAGKFDILIEKADPYVVRSAIVTFRPRRKG